MEAAGVETLHGELRRAGQVAEDAEFRIEIASAILVYVDIHQKDVDGRIGSCKELVEVVAFAFISRQTAAHFACEYAVKCGGVAERATPVDPAWARDEAQRRTDAGVRRVPAGRPADGIAARRRNLPVARRAG